MAETPDTAAAVAVVEARGQAAAGADEENEDEEEEETLGKSSDVLRRTNPFLTDVKGGSKTV